MVDDKNRVAMHREFSTKRPDPEDRNGAAPARPGNGFGMGAGSDGNGHGAVTGSADSNGHGNSNGNARVGFHGNVHDGPAPTHGSIGASAVVRPVPGGEHKGMLKLVDFTQPANGTVTRNADQTLTFRPKPGFTGKDSFDYTLCDDAGTIFSATVTVAVTLEATGHFDPTPPRPFEPKPPRPVAPTPPHVVEPDTA